MITLRTANKNDRIAARFIPQGATRVDGLPEGATAYTYERAGQYLVIGFRGTAARAEFHYNYRNPADRQACIDRFAASVKDQADRRAARRDARNAWVNPLTVGTILYTSWGYDQTNVDFFVVTAVAGKRVKVAPIAADSEATGFMQGRTWPAIPIKIVGAETTHIAQPCGDRGACVTIDGHTAWVEDGRAHSFSTYA